MTLGPLNPVEAGLTLGLDAADAHLITGGLPGIIRTWVPGTPPLDFPEAECADPASPVFSVPESTLLAEFATPDQARRGRPETAVALLHKRWSTWRGRAVEPLIREALELTASAQALPWPDTTSIGGWWNRQFNPEVDLVGADRAPVAGRIHFTGSIKWLNTPFDHHDLHALHTACVHVPGFDPESTEHAVVSLSGTTDLPRPPRLVWGPTDVLNAWTATA
ncbi:DUF234 domain-containing protein [Actinokineospora sp. PR83]|uniref:DUF234 domain-containing protein n=1 Tax=Actinokineospora sp. PR83 TaxID=2884908 RepID=UPI001F33B4B1|nr:DUF234 domain-containing protein [Actinokineospora sp. PR83]MCG8920371.1 DUF234 domain-containing protein [Actinokineospora sp. PR83]